MEATDKETKSYNKKLGGITGKGFMPGVSGNPNGLRPMTKEQKIVKKVLKKTKEDILKYLEKQGYGAAERIIKISKNVKDNKVALLANKDILDRVGVGTQNKGIGVAVQVNFRDNDLQ